MKVVVLMVDSLRADALGVYNPQARTPTFDRLARSGTIFDTAYAAAPWTLPALAGLLTGWYPHRVGLIHWKQPWPRHRPTLFDRFGAAGYETASWVFHPDWLFTGLPAAHVLGCSLDEEEVFARIRACKADRAVFFVQYWGTHIPYLTRRMPTATWLDLADAMLDVLRRDAVQRGKIRGLYRLAVERFSEVFLPRLLEAVDAGPGLDDTVLVIVSDHGENWGEHLPHAGEERAAHDIFDLHGNVLNEASIRVPLVVVAPGRLPSGRVDSLVRTVDVAPTLYAMAGLRSDAEVPEADEDGRPFLASVRDGAPTSVSSAFVVGNRRLGEAAAAGDLGVPRRLWVRAALRAGDLKWVRYEASPVHGTRRQVYDVRADPDEQRPLTIDETAASELDGWAEIERELALCELAEVPADLEERARHRALEG